MIFKSAAKITDKAEKSFFIEQISVYIRLVQVFCEKKQLEFNFNRETSVLNELVDIGVIEKSSELPDLKNVLGEKYDEF